MSHSRADEYEVGYGCDSDVGSHNGEMGNFEEAMTQSIDGRIASYESEEAAELKIDRLMGLPDIWAPPGVLEDRSQERKTAKGEPSFNDAGSR